MQALLHRAGTYPSRSRYVGTRLTPTPIRQDTVKFEL